MTKLRASATTTEIPMTFRIFGGKAAIVLPDGSRAIARQEATIDSTMVKIIARAFRWQRLLDDGTYATIDDMAASEKISPSYVSRVVRLALLSPEIVETIRKIAELRPALTEALNRRSAIQIQGPAQVDAFVTEYANGRFDLVLDISHGTPFVLYKKATAVPDMTDELVRRAGMAQQQRMMAGAGNGTFLTGPVGLPPAPGIGGH